MFDIAGKLLLAVLGSAVLTYQLIAYTAAPSMVSSYTDCQAAASKALSLQNIHNGQLSKDALAKMDSTCGAMAIQAKAYEAALLPK